MSRSPNPFGPGLFAFMRELKENNNREWFQANKSRYETEIKDPSLRFISDFGSRLERISPHFTAIPKVNGGSLFRIYRDTRFSNDKTPYKTAVGIRFPHEQARDVHAPGFYLHLEPRQVFIGLGIWHPDGATLKRVRDAMIDDPGAWKRTLKRRSFGDSYEIGGESLKRAPRGYDPEHELVEDLRRKDYVAYRKLRQSDALAADFPTQFAKDLGRGAPFIRYLCEALDLPF